MQYSEYSNVVTPNTKWWLAGGVTAENCIAAYQPIGAANQAASYINLANPGTYNITEGTAPTWNAIDGWIFDGTPQYLKTGVVPVNDQTWSMVVCYDDWVYNGSDEVIVGLFQGTSARFELGLRQTSCLFANGNFKSVGKARIGSYLTVAGSKCYPECEDGEVTIGAPSGTITYDIWIGQSHYSSNRNPFYGSVQSLAIYNKVLSQDELTAIQYRQYLLRGTNIDKRLEYLSKQRAALIHWNMPVFHDLSDVPGDLDPDTFAPTDLDIDQWLDACAAAGIEVAYLTTKHHDGFMLWPSAQHVDGYDPYTIERTTWYANNGDPDIVGLFVAGCNLRGIKPGLYISMWDKTHEERTGTDETTDPAAYIAMLEEQVTELLSNYGDIYAIWFDGWGWGTYYHYLWPQHTYDLIKTLQSDIIIINNDHFHPSFRSEIECYEPSFDGYIPAGNTRFSEVVESSRTDGEWFWKSYNTNNVDDFQTAAYIKGQIDDANGKYGMYNLGLIPGRDGHLPTAQVTILNELETL